MSCAARQGAANAAAGSLAPGACAAAPGGAPTQPLVPASLRMCARGVYLFLLPPPFPCPSRTAMCWSVRACALGSAAVYAPTHSPLFPPARRTHCSATGVGFTPQSPAYPSTSGRGYGGQQGPRHESGGGRGSGPAAGRWVVPARHTSPLPALPGCVALSGCGVFGVDRHQPPRSQRGPGCCGSAWTCRPARQRPSIAPGKVPRPPWQRGRAWHAPLLPSCVPARRHGSCAACFCAGAGATTRAPAAPAAPGMTWWGRRSKWSRAPTQVGRAAGWIVGGCLPWRSAGGGFSWGFFSGRRNDSAHPGRVTAGGVQL
jgi:hypothetical protein